MRDWITPLISNWVFGVKQLATVATTYPQIEYAGMVVSLHAEWQYNCRIVSGICSVTVPVETAIQEHFLQALFGGHTPITIDDNFCCLLSHSVRRAKLGIRNPMVVVDHLFEASKEATEILVRNLASGDKLSLEAH